ncbi:MAG TPA: tRNA (adenosine(37)-N6)-threonylcarbamoyltransferase complex dimerization subunit type 1 TsaB [Ferruginibacter sp.]|nr:tRNA (adenosine(37)-N6)-threonylcarbamoyltransferase complex dimerization subunit type 1 TsaB [Ferruginibacter sp.]HMP21053.1 tRNA (adenosine(37)-N6)-threonylcarbamoyltransferase complex dimerization subunit type 1 TsaB [Ferruginibacter sp.]
MPLIINIDTSTEAATVSIASNGELLAVKKSLHQKDHAAFVQPAIQEMLHTAGIPIQDIAAIAVSAGPGSYTGLRVGMSSAKGLCFALNIPLVAVPSLAVEAAAAIASLGHDAATNRLFCPMTDARRMEVFTALYNDALEMVWPARALIVEPDSFQEWLNDHSIYFSGTGSAKWQTLCKHPNAKFISAADTAKALGITSYKKYLQGDFSAISTSTPLYIKDFHSIGNR